MKEKPDVKIALFYDFQNKINILNLSKTTVKEKYQIMVICANHNAASNFLLVIAVFN